MNRGVLVVLLSTSSVVAAQPPTARVAVEGPCELPRVAERTNELLGREGIIVDGRSRIEIVTSAIGDTVAATLTFVDEHGLAQPSREIAAASCDEIEESIAIVGSLVLRQGASPEPPPVTPARAEPSPAAPVRTAPPAVEDTTAAPARTKRGVALELGAATSSAGRSALVVAGRLDYARISLAVDLELAAPATIDVAPGAVDVIGARASLAGCWRASRFAACGALVPGIVRATGEDLAMARSAIRPSLAAGVRAEWRQRMARHLGVRVFAAVEQTLVRARFLVDDMPAWASPSLQAWLGAGIFFQLP